MERKAKALQGTEASVRHRLTPISGLRRAEIVVAGCGEPELGELIKPVQPAARTD